MQAGLVPLPRALVAPRYRSQSRACTSPQRRAGRLDPSDARAPAAVGSARSRGARGELGPQSGDVERGDLGDGVDRLGHDVRWQADADRHPDVSRSGRGISRRRRRQERPGELHDPSEADACAIEGDREVAAHVASRASRSMPATNARQHPVATCRRDAQSTLSITGCRTTCAWAIGSGHRARRARSARSWPRTDRESANAGTSMGGRDRRRGSVTLRGASRRSDGAADAAAITAERLHVTPAAEPPADGRHRATATRMAVCARPETGSTSGAATGGNARWSVRTRPGSRLKRMRREDERTTWHDDSLHRRARGMDAGRGAEQPAKPQRRRAQRERERARSSVAAR